MSNANSNAPITTPLNASPDDLVGILIHNANQLAAALSVKGAAVEWDRVRLSLARMDALAVKCAIMVDEYKARAENGTPN